MVIVIAKYFVVIIETRLMQSELISQFYQVEKPHKDINEEDTDLSQGGSGSAKKKGKKAAKAKSKVI